MFLSQLKAALAALRARLEDLETEKRSLADETTTLLAKPAAETRNLDAAETARFQEIVARSAAIPAEVADIERQVGEHEQQIAYLESVDAARSRPTAPNFNRTHEPVAPPDVRNLSRSQAREAAKRKIDECPDAERQAILDKMIRTASPRRDDGLRSFDGDEVARMMLITESDAYRSAFMKGITTQSPAWTADEVRALNEVRAMQAYTNAGGGFGVPIFIDPTIIITTSTNRSPILDVARIENITTTAWKGVSGAGAAWSFDAESAAVSDDSVTLAQPSVTAHMARGFIPFSMEFEDDYPNGAGELGNVLDVGYHDLLASKLINGTGTAEPWGIVAALDANTNVEVTPTTDGAFGAVDIDKVWKSLPERCRGSSPNRSGHGRTSHAHRSAGCSSRPRGARRARRSCRPAGRPGSS